MRPYADNTFYVIGMEKGWFKDVGITITPEPDGLKTTENQWVLAAAQPPGRHQLGDLRQAAALLQEHRPAEMRRFRGHLLGLRDARQPEARA